MEGVYFYVGGAGGDSWEQGYGELAYERQEETECTAMWIVYFALFASYRFRSYQTWQGNNHKYIYSSNCLCEFWRCTQCILK